MGGAACPSLREGRIIESAFALHSAIHAALEGATPVYVSVAQAPFERLGRMFCKELARLIADYWNRDPSYLAGARRWFPAALSRLFLFPIRQS
jgi:hypothetical protein